MNLVSLAVPLFLTSIILTTISNRMFRHFAVALRSGDSPSSTGRLGETRRELYVQSFLPKLSVKLQGFPSFAFFLPFFFLYVFKSNTHQLLSIICSSNQLLSCKLTDGMRSMWVLVLIIEVERSNTDI